MVIHRYSKILCVLAIAFFCSLVSFGNITDYQSNFSFVEHVFKMDTIFPDASIRYRAIEEPNMHHIGYVMIIILETLTAILCWIGAFKMFQHRSDSAEIFHRSKNWAIIGLTIGFLTWQVGFMSIGGEWFGMWMSQVWNGIQSAFRFFMTILGVMIYISLRDTELDGRSHQALD
jgi:predicted small integral membrane protein